MIPKPMNIERAGGSERLPAPLDRIKLAKNDPTAGGEHHFIPLAWVERVDEHVHLSKTTEDARAEWQGGSE